MRDAVGMDCREAWLYYMRSICTNAMMRLADWRKYCLTGYISVDESRTKQGEGNSRMKER